MENLQQKDERLKNQSETIASLERKVESLEKELQKHLDPDSGTINPSVRYHYKGGEAALLEKIDSLEKQLNDCMENESKWIRSNPFKAVIYNTIAAQFMPVAKYNTYHKEWFYENPKDLWFLFRSAIFDGPECAHLLQSQAFRDVIWSMNNFIDDLHRPAANFELFTSTAEVIIDNTTAEGWALLLEALDLEQNSDHVFAERADAQWLRLAILNIHRCVKMFHEAAEPEEKKEVQNSLTK